MDWFTLVLVFIFFVLPLIQQIAEARRRSQNPPPVGDDDEVEFDPEPQSSGRTTWSEPAEEVTQPSGAREGWSSEWGRWPVEEAEPEITEAPVIIPVPQREPVTVRIEPSRRAEPTAPEQRPERAAPEPRVERVIFERSIPEAAAGMDGGAEGRRVPGRSRELSVPVLGARRGSTVLGVAVHDRRELRRAILLNEVLGPPRALKPLEQEQR